MIKKDQLQEKLTCPICFSNESKVLWTTNSTNAAQHYVLKEKYPENFNILKSHIEILWGQKTCEVLRCNNCGFSFSSPFIAGDEHFYSLAYDRTGYPSWKWEFQQTLEVINNSYNSNLKLFEIGAGNGGFLKRIAKDFLPKENIFSTEFSKYGKHELEKNGITCYSDDFRNLRDSELKENFDIVCMFQVLEHLDEIDLTFQKLNWFLKDGGSLFIAVPNAERINFNELNEALLDMPPNHIGRWNKKSFEIIGSKHGFRVKDYKIENFDFFAMSIQFIYYRMLKKSQNSGSFENRIFQIKNKYLLQLSKLIGFIVNLFIAFPILFKKGTMQGNSQWVHLIKI